MAPFTAAALQVYFTALAADLPGGLVERVPSGCPVCGSPPVAGVVMGDDKLRYLTCSLCSSEWNLTRLQCWRCRSTGGISYLAIAGEDGVKAEACASCGAYVKLFYREQMPAAEPLADDVASLTLDLLAAQEGWAAAGSTSSCSAAARDSRCAAEFPTCRGAARAACSPRRSASAPRSRASRPGRGCSSSATPPSGPAPPTPRGGQRLLWPSARCSSTRSRGPPRPHPD